MSCSRRVACLTILTALSLACAPLHAQGPRGIDVTFVRIATGPIGGTYFPVGGLIAQIISGPPGLLACDQGGSCGVSGLIAAAVSTQGSVENVRSLANGSVDFALCQANVAHDAYIGAGGFAGKPVTNLRAIANLFPEALHVVVRRNSDIAGFADLKGQRVSVGEENSGTFATAKLVLRGYGLSIKDIKPYYEKLTRSVDLLMAGQIDAFFMVSGHPVGAIVHAAERLPISLLAVADRDAERIVKANSFLSVTQIPAGAYPGVPTTQTIGVGAHLLVSADKDTELVYAVTRALWDPRNRKILDGGNPNARRMQLRTARDGLSIPLHPGAARFYEEVSSMSEGQP